MAITEILKRFELTDTESTNIVKINCKTSGDKKVWWLGEDMKCLLLGPINKLKSNSFPVQGNTTLYT